MNILRQIFIDDFTKYAYLMSVEELHSYHLRKMFSMLMCMVISIIVLCFTSITIYKLQMVILFIFFGYKMPFILLKLRHNQQCNRIVDAIPIWVNMIYSLIGENNIYNAIVISYEDAPKIIKKDLTEFIEKIHIDNSDKDAYIDFLSQYKIEHFKDIMMKLFEFRNLSKDKLKYEISLLNESLAGIELIKRERRYKNELFMADSLTLVMMCIPCMYMFFVSLILSELMLS